VRGGGTVRNQPPKQQMQRVRAVSNSCWTDALNTRTRQKHKNPRHRHSDTHARTHKHTQTHTNTHKHIMAE
jgi:hypothetical protein